MSQLTQEAPVSERPDQNNDIAQKPVTREDIASDALYKALTRCVEAYTVDDTAVHGIIDECMVALQCAGLFDESPAPPVSSPPTPLDVIRLIEPGVDIKTDVSHLIFQGRTSTDIHRTYYPATRSKFDAEAVAAAIVDSTPGMVTVKDEGCGGGHWLKVTTRNEKTYTEQYTVYYTADKDTEPKDVAATDAPEPTKEATL